MSSMVERVARGIAAYAQDQNYDAPGDVGHLMRTMYQGMARAAIEAMMEPTKEMVLVGYTEINNNIDSWNYESDSGYAVEDIAPTATWRAMITAALEDK